MSYGKDHGYRIDTVDPDIGFGCLSWIRFEKSQIRGRYI